MPKNIVICCDGTGNQFNLERNSNVVKLYSTLIINDRQIGYYHPGVGTMGAPAALHWYDRVWTQVKGLAFGYGLFEDVGRAYQYLMENYQEHDKIYLFGFSRGAYTVRALASLLKMFGLLCPGNEAQIPYVLRMFDRRGKADAHEDDLLEEARVFQEIFSRKCFVHFLGVWDTVSSVGWVTEPVRLPYTARNPIVANIRHALSIDERRIFFRQNTVRPLKLGDELGDGTTSPITQDVKQVWFAGVHSDVGGSYLEQESGLAKITLEWMLIEAMGKDLLVDPERAKKALQLDNPDSAPNPYAQQHESLTGPWWILEFLPHRQYNFKTDDYSYTIPLGRHRYIAGVPQVHETVRLRMADPKLNYAPANLPQGRTEEPWIKFKTAEAKGA